MTPISLSWQDAELTRSVSSFQGFCDLLGLGKVQEYLVSRQVHKVEDWSQYQLDAEGRAIQTELNERFQVRQSLQKFPIKAHTFAVVTLATDQVIYRCLE